MKIIAIIPARGGSKGIPKKNITPFCGMPLIYWSVTQAISSGMDEVIVSTDDQEIKEVVNSFDFSLVKVIDRPADLAEDTSSSEDALLHVLDSIEEQPDFVVFLQATSPLRRACDIPRALNRMVDKNLDSLFSASIVDDITLWDGKGNSITYDWTKRGRRQDRPKYYLENGSIFIFKPEVLRKNHNRLGGKIGMYIMDSWQSFEIDNLEGLELCEYYFKKRLRA
jgi:N-acylneuraminate cytidylyltransferase